MTGEERTLRSLLQLAANTVHPDPAGLTRIRARITRPRPWWRRAWDRLTGPHVCDPHEDPIDPTDVRCRICGQRPNEGTAAPAGTEAAVEPDGWKEPKDMSHDLIEESTPRGQQLAAALALAHLIEAGPKVLCAWRIDRSGGLNGSVIESDRGPRGDARARAAVEAFAEFLAVPVKRSQGRSEHSEWLTLTAAGEYRGTEVTVWTHVDVRPVSPYGSFEGRTA